MPYPTLARLEQLSAPLRGLLSRYSAALAEYLRAEHNDDGSHGDVTADTLTSAAGVYDYGRTTAMGVFTDVPYQALHFTAATGAWTVQAADIVTYAWALGGEWMTVLFEINTTSVTGATADLRIAIPDGYTATSRTRNPVQAIDAGAAAVTGIARVVEDEAFIRIQPTIAGTANWTITAANDTAVRGQISFRVNRT